MFTKNNDYVLIKIENKYYITAEYKHFEVNETAARIFSLCNGKNTIEDIAKKLSDKYNTDFTETLSLVEMFIKNLLELDTIKK